MRYRYWLLILTLWIDVAQSEAIDLSHQSETQPLFVSLGCTSRLASYFNNVGIKSRFPFNLLLTTDSKGFINLLEDDFNHFLDKNYLVQDLSFNGITYRVINTYYNIDFRHDWHDIDPNFEEDLPKIQQKYQKLIDGFRLLADYSGKVYFIRLAYPGDWINPNYFLPTIINDCLTISYTQAEWLKNVLERKFPKLNYTLVIINHIEDNTPDIVGLDKVMEFKIRKMHPAQDFVKVYQSLLKNINQK